MSRVQEELTARGLDTRWTPLKGKKELVDRLQASTSCALCFGCLMLGNA